MSNLKFPFVAAGLLALSVDLPASGKVSAPPDPAYLQECGSCHVAYPARLLSNSSWQALLSGLDHHFGVDASLEPDARAEVSRYLDGNARRKETVGSDGKPLLRITETRWFRHEHDEVPEATWKRPGVKSPANCSACHVTAEQGTYSERNIRLPR